MFGSRAGLQHVKQPEPHRLLAIGVALHLNVGAVPEVVEIVALRLEQTIPPAVLGARYRAQHLIA